MILEVLVDVSYLLGSTLLVAIGRAQRRSVVLTLLLLLETARRGLGCIVYGAPLSIHIDSSFVRLGDLPVMYLLLGVVVSVRDHLLVAGLVVTMILNSVWLV